MIVDITAMIVATRLHEPEGWARRKQPVSAVVTLNEETSRPVWSTLQGLRPPVFSSRQHVVPPSPEDLLAAGLLKLAGDFQLIKSLEVFGNRSPVELTKEQLRLLSPNLFHGYEIRLMVFGKSSIRVTETEQLRSYFVEILRPE